MKNRTGNVLMLGFAALLAANLLRSDEPAVAGPSVYGEPEPYLVGISAIAPDPNWTMRYVFRAWSDGRVEVNHAANEMNDGTGSTGWVGWRELDDAAVGDVNNDGVVNASDLSLLLGSWG